MDTYLHQTLAFLNVNLISYNMHNYMELYFRFIMESIESDHIMERYALDNENFTRIGPASSQWMVPGSEPEV